MQTEASKGLVVSGCVGDKLEFRAHLRRMVNTVDYSNQLSLGELERP